MVFGQVLLLQYKRRFSSVSYLLLFKEPGEYAFDETSREFNCSGSSSSEKMEIYCTAPNRSKDYVTYWDGDQKLSVVSRCSLSQQRKELGI
jgi:hypothetical protein